MAIQKVFIHQHILTAAALAGVDLLANDRGNVSGNMRVMSSVAVVGSAAIGDFWVDVFIGPTFVGRFYNTNITVTGIDQARDPVPVGPLAVPPGYKITAIAGVNCGAGNVDIQIK